MHVEDGAAGSLKPPAEGRLAAHERDFDRIDYDQDRALRAGLDL